MSPIATRTATRRLAALLGAAVLTLVSLVGPASPAQAASYRYWGYYTWTDGAWVFATKGPDQTKPADGAVEGWRFAVTSESGSPRVPRADGDFAAICAGTDA
ncbi:MAG: SCO2322 family protein, partial [Actinomycetes bacterium]